MSYSADCTPMWATVEQLITHEPALGLTFEDAEEALIEATWLLSGLLGDYYHGAECRTDEYQVRRHCKIYLAHQPVDEILSVERVDPCGGTVEQIEGWCALPGGYLRVCCRTGMDTLYQSRPPFGQVYGGVNDLAPCRCDDSIIRVQYRVKSNLPPGTKRNVMKLALEFAKSHAGKSCSLPERVTSVNRQGVSWTILDPLDFLDKGLTGIGSVDQWISAVRRRGAAGLIDPLTRPHLLLSEITGCGPECTGV